MKVVKQMDTDRQGYRYRPLLNEDDVRVLYVEPGAAEQPIRCRLKQHKLLMCDCILEGDGQAQSNCSFCHGVSIGVPYEALSYTWGDQSIRENICLASEDEEQFRHLSVTANCFQALQRFRLEHDVTRLWVDAICIDQENLKERSAQVLVMHRIYRSAMKVLVYLGEESSDSNLAITVLEDEAASRRQHITDDLEPHEVEALQSFFTRPWFTRVWVLEEVAWAQSIDVLCGARVTPWATIHKNYTSWIGFHPALTPLPYVVKFGGCVSTKAKKFTAENFFRELCSTRSYLATDPRDKIFALLPLFHPREDNDLLSVDYSRSLPDVFRLAAVYLLERLGPTILSRSYNHQEALASGLPTWVPNWSGTHVYKPSELSANVPSPARLSIHNDFGPLLALGSESRPQPPIIFTDRLVIQGFSVGKIGVIGTLMKDTGTGLDESSQLQTWKHTIIDWTYAVPATLLFSKVFCQLIFHRTHSEWIEEHPDIPWDSIEMRRVVIEFCRGSVPKPNRHLRYQSLLLEELPKLAMQSFHKWRNRRIVSIVPAPLLGMTTDDVEIGDEVFRLEHAPYWYVLRKYRAGYIFVGDCYVCTDYQRLDSILKPEGDGWTSVTIF